jgi:hypothetical protein
VDERVVGDVDDERQQAGARRRAAGTRAPALAEVGVLDDAGDVGDREALVVPLDHPEVGRQRGEGVRGHLGAGVGERGEQARLAGVGVADQADVGDRAQLEPQPPLLPRRAVLGEARGAPVGVGEGGVAAARRRRRRRPGALADLDEVGEDLAGVGIDREGADRAPGS